MRRTVKLEHVLAHAHNKALEKLMEEIRFNDWALLSVDHRFRWDHKKDEDKFEAKIVYDDGVKK